MKSRALMASCATAALAITSLAACSQDSEGGSDNPTLGIVQFSGTDVTVNAVIAAAQASAEAAGWDVNVIDAQGATDKANSAIQNLVSADVDAILVTVFSSDALSAGLEDASAAGIPVVSHGGGEGDGVGVVFNVDAGAAIVERMISDLGDEGAVLALTYKAGLPCLQRETALDAALAEASGIEVTKQEIDVSQATNSGLAAANAWLAGHPSGPRAIWGCYDDPALGAISALKQQGVAAGEILVYGFNNAPDAQTAIADGFMTASAWFDSNAAGAAEFAAAKALADGENPPAVDEVPSVIIDIANLESWAADHPDGF